MQVIPSGTLAMQYLRTKEAARNAPPPDLLPIDLVLPDLKDGEIIEFIETSTYVRQIPWCVLSAVSEPSHPLAPLVPSGRWFQRPAR